MTGAAPRYSIVIPAYNAAAYIAQAIESVIAQTETNWNLIVVDDGSTDVTLELLRGFDDARLTVISQRNQGVSAARNSGLSACRADYVLLLDADDLLFPDALRQLGGALDRHPEAVLSYGTCCRFESTPPPMPRPPLRLRRKPSGEALASLLARNSLVTGAVLVRRQALDRTNGFDCELAIGEDWVFWCDLAALGPIHFAGYTPVLAYRYRVASAMRTLGANPTALWPAIERLFAREAVRRRFPAAKLARLRRYAEASALSAVAGEFVQERDWARAPAVLWKIARRDPLSLLLDMLSIALEEISTVFRQTRRAKRDLPDLHQCALR